MIKRDCIFMGGDKSWLHKIFRFYARIMGGSELSSNSNIQSIQVYERVLQTKKDLCGKHLQSSCARINGKYRVQK